MKRRRAKNPFPGVNRVVDRHDKVRWRFRMKGRPSCYLRGEYNSPEFRAEYEKAVKGEQVLPAAAFEYASIDWLIEQYMRTAKWSKLAEISRVNLRHEFERFRKSYGSGKITTLTPANVESLIAKKADKPAAANRLLKLIRRLARFAIKKGIITNDPSIGIERYQQNQDGFHTWTEEEIAKFIEVHGLQSKAVLALKLILCTGAARQDVARLGWQNVKDGRISYRRGKTGGDVDLPIIDELLDVLALVPRDRLIFVTHGEARPYKATTFGNWFRDQCVAADLPHCSSHGLRKAGATRLADAGANELEIMSFLGHSTPNEARTYVKKANRKALADRGMARLAEAKKVSGVSNLVPRLDKRVRKQRKTKEN